MGIKIAILGNTPYWCENLRNRLNITYPNADIKSFRSSYSFFQQTKSGTVFDVVVIDGVVDGRLGSEITKEICSNSPTTHVIGYSNNSKLALSFIESGAICIQHSRLFTNQIKDAVQNCIS